MTVFWKPVRSVGQLDAGRTPIKHLGAGLYALWGRCALCDWSGPFERFTMWGHEDHAKAQLICDTCKDDRSARLALEAGGWRYVG
jgi:hypothetical protein